MTHFAKAAFTAALINRLGHIVSSWLPKGYKKKQRVGLGHLVYSTQSPEVRNGSKSLGGKDSKIRNILIQLWSTTPTATAGWLSDMPSWVHVLVWDGTKPILLRDLTSQSLLSDSTACSHREISLLAATTLIATGAAHSISADGALTTIRGFSLISVWIY